MLAGNDRLHSLQGTQWARSSGRIARMRFMAIQYGALVVDGLEVTGQTLTLTGTGTGLTNVEGISPDHEHLVAALNRVGAAGWSLVTTYVNNVDQTTLFIFSRQA